jgi:hypothetical protein
MGLCSLLKTHNYSFSRGIVKEERMRGVGQFENKGWIIHNFVFEGNYDGFEVYLNLKDIDPQPGLSFFRDGRCRCQAQRDMIADNMEKEITITRSTWRS